jgi:hypothetical protein
MTGVGHTHIVPRWARGGYDGTYDYEAIGTGGGRRLKEGERGLLCAILERAYNDLFLGAEPIATGVCFWGEKINPANVRRDAINWFLRGSFSGPDDIGGFTFETVCSYLDLDSNLIRIHVRNIISGRSKAKPTNAHMRGGTNYGPVPTALKFNGVQVGEVIHPVREEKPGDLAPARV